MTSRILPVTALMCSLLFTGCTSIGSFSNPLKSWNNDKSPNEHVLPAPGLEGTTVARFKINSAHLNGKSHDALDTFLKGKMDASFTIIGHTCDLGSEAFNQKLSEKRADTVMRYLLKNGISADQITVKGDGEHKPMVPNTSEANRKMNRRVEILLEG